MKILFYIFLGRSCLWQYCH